jgi:ribosomal protein S17E
MRLKFVKKYIAGVTFSFERNPRILLQIMSKKVSNRIVSIVLEVDIIKKWIRS